LIPASRAWCAAGKKIYPRNLPPADIKILSSNGVSGLAGMWETNTFKASLYARLNVASSAAIRPESRYP
jgi:hypothetical protein